MHPAGTQVQVQLSGLRPVWPLALWLQNKILDGGVEGGTMDMFSEVNTGDTPGYMIYGALIKMGYFPVSVIHLVIWWIWRSLVDRVSDRPWMKFFINMRFLAWKWSYLKTLFYQHKLSVQKLLSVYLKIKISKYPNKNWNFSIFLLQLRWKYFTYQSLLCLWSFSIIRIWNI